MPKIGVFPRIGETTHDNQLSSKISLPARLYPSFSLLVHFPFFFAIPGRHKHCALSLLGIFL